MHSALYTILQNAFIFFSAKLSPEHFAECRCNFSLIQSCLGKFHMISSCFFFLFRKILLLPFDLCLIRIKAEANLEAFLVVKFSLFNLLIQILVFFDKLEYAVEIPQFGIYLIPFCVLTYSLIGYSLIFLSCCFLPIATSSRYFFSVIPSNIASTISLSMACSI